MSLIPPLRILAEGNCKYAFGFGVDVGVVGVSFRLRERLDDDISDSFCSSDVPTPGKLVDVDPAALVLVFIMSARKVFGAFCSSSLLLFPLGLKTETGIESLLLPGLGGLGDRGDFEPGDPLRPRGVALTQADRMEGIFAKESPSSHAKIHKAGSVPSCVPCEELLGDAGGLPTLLVPRRRSPEKALRRYLTRSSPSLLLAVNFLKLATMRFITLSLERAVVQKSMLELSTVQPCDRDSDFHTIFSVRLSTLVSELIMDQPSPGPMGRYRWAMSTAPGCTLEMSRAPGSKVAAAATQSACVTTRKLRVFSVPLWTYAKNASLNRCLPSGRVSPQHGLVPTHIGAILVTPLALQSSTTEAKSR